MQNAVNNVPLAPRIASGVSDQKEVISFFCGNDKFVVSIAKSFIYHIIDEKCLNFTVSNLWPLKLP